MCSSILQSSKKGKTPSIIPQSLASPPPATLHTHLKLSPYIEILVVSLGSTEWNLREGVGIGAGFRMIMMEDSPICVRGQVYNFFIILV